jgi:hypothetical protein
MASGCPCKPTSTWGWRERRGCPARAEAPSPQNRRILARKRCAREVVPLDRPTARPLEEGSYRCGSTEPNGVLAVRAPRYDLALIPCAHNKNPTGVNPRTLYRSTVFITSLRHALQRCDRILILSSKYGLIRPDDPVSYYEAYLPTLTQQQLSTLREKLFLQWGIHQLERVPPSRVLCYLSKSYYEILATTTHFSTWSLGLLRPYKTLGNVQLIKALCHEIREFETSRLASR